ncbi:MAG: helix-turn-helix domain-containing protein [Pseudomonadota bacterium]
MRPTNSRLSAEERKHLILEAALNVFAQKGFSGARTKEIAQEAGVSETLLFRHFVNKENLYAEARQHLFAHHPIAEEIEPAMQAGDDREVLYIIARHIMEHVGCDERIVRLTFFSSLEGLRMAEHQSTPIQILEGYFAKRKQEGALQAKDPRLAARFFMFALFLYVSDIHMNFAGSPLGIINEEAARNLADLFMDGLVPRE